MTLVSRTVAAVVMFVALSGCDGDASRPPTSPTDDSPSTSGTLLERETDPTRCANQEEAAAAGINLGGDVTADITGDETEDVAYLVRDEKGEIGCRDFLVVETEEGPLVTPLSDPGQDYSLPAPRINALVSVDDEPGAEILVDVEQGASTQFIGMFTAADGSLERVRIQNGSGVGGLFPYGGSVGHIEASDCGREAGTVVVSVATPARDRYEVTRTVYRFQDAELIPDEDASETVMLAPQRLIGLPEFQASPFGNCLRS